MENLAGYALEANIGSVSMLRGEPGKSAYEIAVQNGYSGTETEWLASLSGISATARGLLITVLRNGVYSSDQSANITDLEIALGGSGESGGDPDTPTYTITNELVNVISSNSAASIAEGGRYTATLTAADGYKLDSVVITMGGVDVTTDVYTDGVISIASVTGNVEIAASASAEAADAVLPEEGLIAFFDFRNIVGVTDGSKGNHFKATQGSGGLYSWGSNGTSTEYGVSVNGKEYCSGDTYSPHDFGTEFTWILKSYCANGLNPWGFNNYVSPTSGASTLAPKYNTADSTASVASTRLEQNTVYSDVAIRVSGAKLTVVVNGTDKYEYDGAEYDGFTSWHGTLKVASTYASDAVNTALAVYTRALSDVELVEAVEYLKTMEVA